MITFLRGEVVSSSDKQLILNVNNVGFRISISMRDAQKMPDPGNEVTVYTYMSVREDAIALYGFLSEDDLEIYRKLITVSGIGPKGGIGILSVMDADDVRIAVLSEDAKAIAKAPGIGIKTAQKLILELRDKLDLTDVIAKQSSQPSSDALEAARVEAIDMMTALGYTASEAMKAVRGAKLSEGMSADEILRAALRDAI